MALVLSCRGALSMYVGMEQDAPVGPFKVAIAKARMQEGVKAGVYG